MASFQLLFFGIFMAFWHEFMPLKGTQTLVKDPSYEDLSEYVKIMVNLEENFWIKTRTFVDEFWV